MKEIVIKLTDEMVSALDPRRRTIRVVVALKSLVSRLGIVSKVVNYQAPAEELLQSVAELLAASSMGSAGPRTFSHGKRIETAAVPIPEPEIVPEPVVVIAADIEPLPEVVVENVEETPATEEVEVAFSSPTSPKPRKIKKKKTTKQV
jgi:hypothetical protein